MVHQAIVKHLMRLVWLLDIFLIESQFVVSVCCAGQKVGELKFLRSDAVLDYI